MVKFHIDQSDLDRIILALENIKNIARNDALSVADEAGREYSDLVKQNITSQKFGDFGVARKDDKWKKKYGQVANLFWNWLGTTLSSLSPKMIKRTNVIHISRVGFYNFTGGTASVKAAKTAAAKKETESQSKLRDAIQKAIEKRKQAATKVISEQSEKLGVKYYGPNSDLVKQLNKERGYTK